MRTFLPDISIGDLVARNDQLGIWLGPDPIIQVNFVLDIRRGLIRTLAPETFTIVRRIRDAT
jgi:hypothetical protein